MEMLSYLIFWGDGPGQCRKVYSSSGLKKALWLFRRLERNYPGPVKHAKIVRIEVWVEPVNVWETKGWKICYQRKPQES